MTIQARYESCCPNCKQGIRVGDRVQWEPGTRPVHVRCPPAPPPDRVGILDLGGAGSVESDEDMLARVLQNP